MRMMQGDEYRVPFVIRQNNALITPEDVSNVEIVIGSLTKTYADEEIEYANGEWLFPLTQEETFAFAAAPQPAQVRVKFLTGEVVGIDLGGITVDYSRSKEEL